MNVQVKVTDSPEKPLEPDQAMILTPAQEEALDELEFLVRFSHCVGVNGIEAARGFGTSTVLHAFAARHGVRVLTGEDCMERLALSDPENGDDAVLKFVEEELERTDILVFDGLYSITMTGGIRMFSNPFRMGSLLERVRASGKRFVFSGDTPSGTPGEVRYIEIAAPGPDDYRVVLRNILGEERARNIDVGLLFRFAAGLTLHQLKQGCRLVEGSAPSTDDFIAALQSFVVRANTRTHEVEALSFDSLPGVEALAAKLETHIVMPLENRLLAEKFDIRPKRGVLLYGPPGTGKTSIGRALAHRMKGKFFLIDGSFTTEPPIAFFTRVRDVVRQAKENSPCVLFIDDADVLFGIEHIAGFARYLLSLLDGMESESAARVCLMMTAMDVRKVPEAILRSGRVELWLETRLPDADLRQKILQRWLGTDLREHDKIEFEPLVELTEGFTPADLRRIVADAKALFAADQMAGRPQQDAGTYLQNAIATLIGTRTRMADVLRDETLRIGGPQGGSAKYGKGIGGLAEAGSCCLTKQY